MVAKQMQLQVLGLQPQVVEAVVVVKAVELATAVTAAPVLLS
jgi:hypothetical protein